MRNTYNTNINIYELDNLDFCAIWKPPDRIYILYLQEVGKYGRCSINVVHIGNVHDGGVRDLLRFFFFIKIPGIEKVRIKKNRKVLYCTIRILTSLGQHQALEI